ncbi:hypothetical protein L916_14291 [Phytophthora nicotianae]|nr:hypothetical protein L916_14291 [Phytophthora nicotianae]
MKDLIIKESPHRERPTVWASDSKPYETKSVSTQTDAVAGGRVWAYKPKQKKQAKTFAL